MRRAHNDVDVDGTRVAAFTVFSAATGKVYACGVSADVAAGWTSRHYGGRPDELLELELFDSW